MFSNSILQRCLKTEFFLKIQKLFISKRASTPYGNTGFRRVKVQFDPEQIGTKAFSATFASIRCTEQHTEN